jgi:hypothetical protein
MISMSHHIKCDRMGLSSWRVKPKTFFLNWINKGYAGRNMIWRQGKVEQVYKCGHSKLFLLQQRSHG